MLEIASGRCNVIATMLRSYRHTLLPPSMRKITVPDEGAESLFGTYDENLKHLETQFGVRIRTNGHELIVEGDAADVARAETRARAARRRSFAAATAWPRAT